MRVFGQSQGRGPGAGTWRANALLERQTRACGTGPFGSLGLFRLHVERVLRGTRSPTSQPILPRTFPLSLGANETPETTVAPGRERLAEGAGLTAESSVLAGRERLEVTSDSSGSLGPFGARSEQGTPPGRGAATGLPGLPGWPPGARFRVLAVLGHGLLAGYGAPIGFESGQSSLPGLTDVLGWDPERAVLPVPGAEISGSCLRHRV